MMPTQIQVQHPQTGQLIEVMIPDGVVPGNTMRVAI